MNEFMIVVTLMIRILTTNIRFVSVLYFGCIYSVGIDHHQY